MFYWIDLTTGEKSAVGYATKGLVMQEINRLQRLNNHAFRFVKGPK